MMKEDFFKATYSHLFRNKTIFRNLNKEEEEELIKFADKFLLSGILLKYNLFHDNNNNLINGLKEISKISTLKNLTSKKDLLKIINSLNKSKLDAIVLKGMALNLHGITDSSIRYSRDIDILVEKDNLNKAYNALKKLGYKYANPKTSDKTDILIKHQLPVMKNKNGTFIELHYRVTNPEYFEQCPLTPEIVNNKMKSNLDPDIYIPSIPSLFSHCLYHAFSHHKLEHGPLFLFDLYDLYKYNNSKWPDIRKVMINMDLEEKAVLTEEILNLADSKKLEYSLCMEKIACLMDNFDWKVKSNKLSIFGFTKKRITMEEVMKRWLKLIRFTSHSYQVRLYSIRFWILFLSELIQRLKKIRP